MEYLQTIFVLEWLAHNNMNIQVIDDIDNVWVLASKEYRLYLSSEHANNFSASTLQTIKDFLNELD